MKLWTVNLILRWFGLVLVVQVGDREPTRFWIERLATFNKRTKKP